MGHRAPSADAHEAPVGTGKKKEQRKISATNSQKAKAPGLTAMALKALLQPLAEGRLAKVSLHPQITAGKVARSSIDSTVLPRVKPESSSSREGHQICKNN